MATNEEKTILEDQQEDLAAQLEAANALIEQLTAKLEQVRHSNEAQVNELNRMKTELAEYAARELLLKKAQELGLVDK